MNKRDIISKVKDLKLPEGSYVVFGSCPLAAAGIRESKDIDMMVSADLAKDLKNSGWKQVAKSKKDKPYVKGVFDVHTNWSFSSYDPSLQDLLARANYISGVPFASIYDVKKWKLASGRPKDISDLKLIDAYLSKRKHPVVTICCSASFYKQAGEVKDKLSSRYRVIVPSTAEVMRKTGDYDVSHYKTWYEDPGHYHKKTGYMMGHFREVAKADAILVLNYQKHGVDNYIGGNVLMEMALAFYLRKPIFILNEIPKESPLLEEIIGLNPIVLHGKLSDMEV